MSIGQELLAVPFPEMIQKMGLAIAAAQVALDTNSFNITRMMAGEAVDVDGGNDSGSGSGSESSGSSKIKFNGQEYSLLELGFTPTFYQFVDTIIEVKISISITKSQENKKSSTDFKAGAKASAGWFSGKTSLSASSVSASYASKYQYSAEGSSLIRTKLVPVPPPAILEERIRAVIAPASEGT